MEFILFFISYIFTSISLVHSQHPSFLSFLPPSFRSSPILSFIFSSFFTFCTLSLSLCLTRKIFGTNHVHFFWQTFFLRVLFSSGHSTLKRTWFQTENDTTWFFLTLCLLSYHLVFDLLSSQLFFFPSTTHECAIHSSILPTFRTSFLSSFRTSFLSSLLSSSFKMFESKTIFLMTIKWWVP